VKKAQLTEYIEEHKPESEGGEQAASQGPASTTAEDDPEQTEEQKETDLYEAQIEDILNQKEGAHIRYRQDHHLLLSLAEKF